MSGFTTLDGVFFTLAFVVPGFVLDGVREQFITGRERRPDQKLLRCLTYSAVNYTVFSAPLYFLIDRGVSKLTAATAPA